jgi:hypothetical protein
VTTSLVLHTLQQLCTHTSFLIYFRWSTIQYILSLSTATSGMAWTAVGGEGTTGLICVICSTQDWLCLVSHSTANQTKACMYINGCLVKSRGTCRTRGEGYLVWLLSYSWQGHGNSGNTPSWHVGQPLLYCLSCERWLLSKGRHREGEGDKIDGYFCMVPLVATGRVISPCARRCFGSLTWGPNMKLFNMVNEAGQHAIDRDSSKDAFGNM